MGPISDRLAAAPISWGVCEVPGWGQILPRERVLADMAELGLRATELGPVGYLGPDPSSIRAAVQGAGLAAVGGFVPLVLHDVTEWPSWRQEAERASRLIAGSGGTFFVTAVIADPGWGRRPPLSGQEWQAVADGLARVDEICRAHGIRQVLHPHAGTLVETGPDIDQVLNRSSVLWCLDTGHLAIGGVDPVAFARSHAARIGLVHLKDVNLSVAERMAADGLSLREATVQGLFCPLGRGDLEVAAAVEELEKAGYPGWYVLEQDTVIAERVSPTSVRPAQDVDISIEYLRRHFGSPGEVG